MPYESLSDLELMVLLAVLRAGEDAYGVTVAREIEATGGRPVMVAVIYSVLRRLEARKLVSSWTGEPTAMRGGRAKRFFRVTARGIRAVQDAKRSLTSLWSGVPALAKGTV